MKQIFIVLLLAYGLTTYPMSRQELHSKVQGCTAIQTAARARALYCRIKCIPGYEQLDESILTEAAPVSDKFAQYKFRVDQLLSQPLPSHESTSSNAHSSARASDTHLLDLDCSQPYSDVGDDPTPDKELLSYYSISGSQIWLEEVIRVMEDIIKSENHQTELEQAVREVASLVELKNQECELAHNLLSVVQKTNNAQHEKKSSLYCAIL